MTTTDTLTDTLTNMGVILQALAFSPLVIFLATIGFILALLLLARKAF